MKLYKSYVGDLFKGKQVHVFCDCVIKLDVRGRVVDYTISGTEIIYLVDTGERIIKIGENTPKLKIELI